MSFLLDSNACIRALNDIKSSVACQIAKLPSEQINLCTVVQTELYYGAYKGSKVAHNLAILARFFNQFRVLPFDSQAAMKTGQTRAELAVKGTPIGPYDCKIAAIALVNNLTLITHNIREFNRVEGLQIEDWEENEEDKENTAKGKTKK
ncbi:MAG: type II toxin-antitoxin system VapC family toxin [Candidatus Parabeggiatoa sp. nov. 1]|nr:MAG: type II toxin-antitoxin system VapC family toxin [Gammaproteobacteria bacterium]